MNYATLNREENVPDTAAKIQTRAFFRPSYISSVLRRLFLSGEHGTEKCNSSIWKAENGLHPSQFVYQKVKANSFKSVTYQ